MPKAKRLKVSGTSQAAPAQEKSTIASDHDLPTPAQLQDHDHPLVQIARKHWLKPGKKSPARPKAKADVVKQGLWDFLERDGFSNKSLHLLESLQTLEWYLWPAYTEQSSNFHVLLMALLVTVKKRERLESWTLFDDRPDHFSSFFRRILSLVLDQAMSISLRTHLLCFLIHAFQSLDCVVVRRECAPLVSIAIWQNLSTEGYRETLLEQSPSLRKAWRATLKRYEAADDETKARIRFDRSWLYSLLLHFMGLLHEPGSTSDRAQYCERFVEFLSDLQSQLPTRRYVNSLLQDLHLLPVMRLSPMYNSEDNALLRDLYGLLSHYTQFPIDDQTGVQLGQIEVYDKHCALLAKLQRVSLKHFKDKLTVLALSNFGAIDKRDELETLLQPLTDEEISQLCTLLQIRTAYPESLKLPIDRKYLMEFLIGMYERKRNFQDLTQDMSLVPTEQALYESGIGRADEYDGSRPLALPKLNLQYLSVGDFLWRALTLHRCESFYAIRKDIEAVLRRLRPELRQSGETVFGGFSKMALQISKPTILEIVPPRVGQTVPSLVKAEIVIDVRRLGERVRREWDTLRPDDVVFLLAVESPPQTSSKMPEEKQALHESMGILSVRAAEILNVTDDKGRHVREGAGNLDSKRRIQLKLDAHTYTQDAERAAAARFDVYGRINLLLRRNRRENNFKPFLESVRDLALSAKPLPWWFHEVFLGYGDPAGASYKNLPNRIKKLDYRDTFLNWQHLVESFPGKTVEPDDEASGSFGPPYVLETDDRSDQQSEIRPSKKRRRDAEPVSKAEAENLKVSTYKPPSNGPFPSDAPRKNFIRFTPAQVEAIMSGTQPGLTVVVGPPGTGKTDVAVQIISNIYHNFPNQTTLLVAHSNQALNQLFAKIVALDIDERHLLRLGHGEEDLATDANFGKHGRVESFLDNRQRLLQEVKKLAICLEAPGAHDNSAETAGYFSKVYVEPAWRKFIRDAARDETSSSDLIHNFPFHAYFVDAPQPLFPPEADRTQVMEIAQGCYRHITKIFSELAGILPFEILRRERDKANYLLTNEARIIAMTTTHAAIKRGDISSLGFRYDNVVVEEAAQMTEAENFLPFAMQRPQNGEIPLQRVVLCGDHFQNSPIIQSMAFRHYANLEQSLFSRLVRLGTPTITLDKQGRARPSIAKLYQWRYPSLDNLPDVQTQPEFLRANAGFKYDYQFINVPPFKGRGELEPTPHFIQNLGEAEYAVAIYQYMRLLGYPAEKISILTTYAGQRALVRDILSNRCMGPAKASIFGMPKAVATVDKYQGEQNDYIILSLTRTSRVGYLRDVRRMTVALSRARLGLYVLGRREVFEACPDLRPAFDLLHQASEKLMLVTGEMWPTERLSLEDGSAVEGEVAMENVEHLGQYVFEMTKTKTQRLQEEQDPSWPANDAASEPKEVAEGEDVLDEEETQATEPDILEMD